MAAPEVPSSHTYLLDAPTLTLATIDPNGRPQLSQIWFLAEDGVIKTGLNTLRQKVKNLEANPHVTAFILDTANHQRHYRMLGTIRRDYWAIPWLHRYIWGATAAMLLILERTLSHD